MDIAAAADRAGIVGASGSGAPLGPRLRVRADVVVANGAECEPLLATDAALMALHPRRILEGLGAAMGATGAARGVVAIREGEGAARRAMEAAAAGMAHIEVRAVPDQYPIGDAHLLVPEVTGRIVPEGGRPEAAGVVVANVHTLWHLARALDGEAVTWRYVTVGGAVARPRVMRVPVGMMVGDVLERCGGATVDAPIFVLGGPMQGTLTEDPAASLGREHGGLFVFPGDHPVVEGRRRPLDHRVRQAASACAGCRRCTDYCPRGQLGHGLRPHEGVRAFALGGQSMEAVLAAPLCSGCGVCEVVCPAGLSPRALYQAAQGELAARGYSGPLAAREPIPTGDLAGRRLPRQRVIERMGLSAFAAPPVIEDMDHTPWRVRVPVPEGVGRGAQALVTVGDRVAYAQPLARPLGGEGPWAHTPVPGRVTAVEPGAITVHAA